MCRLTSCGTATWTFWLLAHDLSYDLDVCAAGESRVLYYII
jgi:hypothetical protein